LRRIPPYRKRDHSGLDFLKTENIGIRVPPREAIVDNRGMKKLLLLAVLALSIASSIAVQADPPAPVCPPICGPGQANLDNGK
jgi:hypothetical protein